MAAAAAVDNLDKATLKPLHNSNSNFPSITGVQNLNAGFVQVIRGYFPLWATTAHTIDYSTWAVASFILTLWQHHVSDCAIWYSSYMAKLENSENTPLLLSRAFALCWNFEAL